MKDRVKKVISQVFGVPTEAIADDASPDTLEEWDSVTHLNLVLALEEEFGISLTDEQIVELLSCEIIVATVEESLG